MHIKVLLSFLAAPIIAVAQSVEMTKVRYSESNTVKSVEFSKADRSFRAPQSADAFFSDILRKSPNDDFRKNDEIKLDKGHESFFQFHKGVRVEGAGYNFHYDDEGYMTYANGNYEPISDLDVIPSITKEKAKDLFARYKGLDAVKIPDYGCDLLITVPQGRNSIGQYILAYKVYLNIQSSDNYEFGYVDAHTGEIVKTEPLFNCYSNGKFNMGYQHETKIAQTEYTSNGYRLYDNSRNAIIHTRDLNNSNFSYSSLSEVYDVDNIWNKSEFTDNKWMALDVHWCMQKIIDRLYNYHSKNSIDNNGKTINSYVRAIINNKKDNAAFHGANDNFYFGEGEKVFKPLAAMDVVAHEFGHGISKYQIGWLSSQQYLNEGLSDIWGAIMDYRYGDSNSNTWMIGEQIMKNYDCLRNLASPTAYGAYKNSEDTYGTNSYNSSGDIYERGGVFSHWFYLLVNGGTGTNGHGDSYTLTPVSMDIAESLIVKAVYQGYLRNTTSYEDVREALSNAARDMNVNGLQSSVCNAWYAVGVGYKDPPITGPSLISSSSIYKIDGLRSGYTVSWSLSNSYYNSNCLTQNSLSANQCKITRSSSQDMYDATLTAIVKYNGTAVDTLTKKHLYAHAGFKGTYYNGQSTKQVNLPNPLYVKQNANVVITSPNLIGSTLSHQGDASITSWSHNATTGVLTVGMPSSGTCVVTVVCDNGDTYYLPILVTTNTNILSVVINGSQLEVSLIPVFDSMDELGATELMSLRSNATDPTWMLEVYNAATGEKMYSEKVTDTSLAIDTTGWKPGVYIVRAVVGDEVLTEKVVVK